MISIKLIEEKLEVKFHRKSNKNGYYYEMESLQCSLFLFPEEYKYNMLRGSLVVARSLAGAVPTKALYWTSLNRIENKKLEIMGVVAFADSTRGSVDITRRHKRSPDIRPTTGIKAGTVCTLSFNNTTISRKNL